MKILIVGAGGREHAIAWKLLKNDKIKKIYIAPGNAGSEMLENAENVTLENDINAYVRFAKENEIDLIIEENGILYPVEVKMSGNPKASMGAANPVLDKIPDKKRGVGVILCLIDRKTYLRGNLIALPIEYI